MHLCKFLKLMVELNFTPIIVNCMTQSVQKRTLLQIEKLLQIEIAANKKVAENKEVAENKKVAASRKLENEACNADLQGPRLPPLKLHRGSR